MTEDVKLIIREFLKFLFFGTYIAGAIVFVILITSIDIQALGYIPENSLTERTQETLLAISILLFLYRVKQEKATGLYLVVGLLLCMLIREKSFIFGGVVGAPALFVPLFATSFLVVCYDNICA